MLIHLHSQATTTPKVRLAINSQTAGLSDLGEMEDLSVDRRIASGEEMRRPREVSALSIRAARLATGRRIATSIRQAIPALVAITGNGHPPHIPPY